MTAVVGLRCTHVLGTRLATQSSLFFVASCSATRRYATATKAAPVSKSGKKASAKVPVNAGKQAPSPTAKKASQPPPSTSPRQTAPTAAHKPAETPATSSEKGVKAATASTGTPISNAEQQLAEVDQLMNMSHFYPTADPWGQKTGTLDVQIPYKTTLNPFKPKSIAEFKQNFRNINSNFLNRCKSALGTYQIATVDGFSGHYLRRGGLIDRFFRWPIRSFKYASLDPNAWTADMRYHALETYKTVLKAASMNDEKTVKRLTISSYQDEKLRLMRRRAAGVSYYFRLYEPQSPDAAPEVRELQVGPPAQVVSIRAMEAYLAKEPPKIGNRLMVHALVKFETIQGLQAYSRDGQLLNPEDKPKKIVEYLVMEKRMWYDGPWLIREKLYYN